MARPPPQSYLLRLWREHDDEALRATLIDVAQPAATRHFATIALLLAFLQSEAEHITETPWNHEHYIRSKHL